jgi:hypothetical protein
MAFPYVSASKPSGHVHWVNRVAAAAAAGSINSGNSRGAPPAAPIRRRRDTAPTGVTPLPPVPPCAPPRHQHSPPAWVASVAALLKWPRAGEAFRGSSARRIFPNRLGGLAAVRIVTAGGARGLPPDIPAHDEVVVLSVSVYLGCYN